MALTSVESIEQALNLVDTKKQSLQKAYEELQSRSYLLSSFNFTWTDLDSYFTSIQSQLLHKFSTLQALEFSQISKPRPAKRKDPFTSDPVPARPDLKSLCENMDALGLRRYVIDRPKERATIRAELADAFKHAPDPALMVLDALEGFWDEKLGSWSRLRTSCTLLLEELMRAGVEIGPEVRARAEAVAVEWKVKMGTVHSGNVDEEGREGDGGLGRLGYLQLLATYKLLSDGGYDSNELIDYVVSSSRYRQAVDLCRIIGLESKVSDVIQKLIGKGKQLLALKFIFEFGLTDEFPPVPLLKAYVMDSKKIAQKVRKKGKFTRQSLNDAAMKETNALKSVIKCIEDHGLESQYSKDELSIRIEKLEKEKSDRKRPAAAPVAKPQQKVKQPKQNGSKRAPNPSPFKRNKLPPNSIGIQSHPYLSSSAAGAYGVVGSLVAADPYGGPPADLYGSSGAPLGYSGNPSASISYSSETHAQPGYYNRAIGYDGYDVPSQYRPLYYPQ
ncbi:frigida-like protein 1 [Phtheirospermum japonicum]|uniref:FRIGIDA-like protein n=1 Tax=Phtheirospermum japonicum TaxID=374723 RepID=A0A830CAF8_9LAMI|nr:frigida-like protein 1 [Phtheirospermum japonicum]